MVEVDKVTLAHGSGGVETLDLLKRLVLSRIPDKLKSIAGGVGTDVLDDGATIPLPNGQHLVISIDSYTVKPLFFPGGNIGVLAACGTINDVLMMGGRPLAIVDSIVVEEGFPIDELEVIVNSFIDVITREGVALVGGDFKVMPKGQLDGVVITTAALGIADKVVVDKPRPGDKIIVTDFVGDHGAVIMLFHMGLEDKAVELSKGELKSDVKPLTGVVVPLLQRFGDHINAMRDPTRGGLAGVLNEWAAKSGITIVVDETSIPIRRSVKRYSEMLGVDPLHLASEGVAVLSVDSTVADDVMGFLKSLGLENARIIGEVRYSDRYRGYVLAKTGIGGYRFIEPPRGEIVPRIC